MLPHFQIDTALQGQEGVKLIKKAFKDGNPYALAFVDIRMPPGWDGIETIKHIWKIDPEIQMVICTAYSDYSWEETVEQLGKKDNLLILKKPFDNISVRQLAYSLTKKWQLLQERRNYTKRLEQQVKERTSSLQELLSVTRGTLESSADGILVLDRDNYVVDYNLKLLEMCNIPQSIIDTRQGER
ncbi:response regulator, partial [Legionella drancourtii]|uniref:response regulator n=1 Tax=Legionella drancourtii TaxID=168933 RepID=UPI002D21C047